MTNENLQEQTVRSNVPELSVSELAFSLKKTLEDTYGRVRVRGELSRVTIPGSGHMYADIKDENALINTVCWKGTLSKLSVRPEEGLEVICTGRISTYPARSNYQLIVEDMTLAGEGALLKMLEERKKKLASEGLFEAERKKKLPFIPSRIGVITSPTGAVIRDIMHRLNDRFPRPVLLWPVLVQGDGAAEQIADAIRGFNALKENLKPDLLILARGGGSLEDLMAFNEEVAVRAVSDSEIPLISAVGHETDTTLVDYASDMRAPTPTGAAEMAVPRRIDLLSQVSDAESRLLAACDRNLRDAKEKLANISARLGDPRKLLELKSQSLDHQVHKLTSAFDSGLSKRRERLTKQSALLRHPKSLLSEKDRHVQYMSKRLEAIRPKLIERHNEKLVALVRMLNSLSFENVIKRGFVLVRDNEGRPIMDSSDTKQDQKVDLQFRDGILGAYIDKNGVSTKKKTVKKGNSGKIDDQGQLF